MACSCKGKRQQFEVVSPDGEVLFKSGAESTARAFSRRPNCKGCTVRPKAKPETTAAKKQSTTKKAVNRA